VSHEPDSIEPDPNEPVEALAGEIFVHGLLQSVRADGADNIGARIRAVMAAIPSDAAPRRHRRWPWLLVAAAALAAWLAWPSPPRDARGLTAAAIEAAAMAGDRTYGVEAWLPGEAEPVLRGAFDVRDASHHLLRATLHGFPLTVGADGDAPWFRGDDRVAAHLRQSREVPGAFELGEGLTLPSPDALLQRLARDYRVELRPIASPTPAGTSRVRLAAERRTESRLPDHIEVWLDPASHLAQRMELRWHDGASGTGHLLRFELVGRAAFPAGWFRPERHDR